MASRFVADDEEFIEELRNTSENKNTQKKGRTTGLKFCNNGQRQEEKMSTLKATKQHSPR